MHHFNKKVNILWIQIAEIIYFANKRTKIFTFSLIMLDILSGCFGAGHYSPHMHVINDGIIFCRLLLSGYSHAQYFFVQDYTLLMSKMGIFICLACFMDLFI